MRYTFMRFPEGKAKCVTLSYDDARKSDIRLSDLLQKYGLKCTFNVTGEKFRVPEYNLTAAEIKEYIISHVVPSNNVPTIIDPSCGCGDSFRGSHRRNGSAWVWMEHFSGVAFFRFPPEGTSH